MAAMQKADAEFLRAMIEHHKSALDMAQKYLDSSSPTTRLAKVADLARSVIKNQTAEIGQMQAWLKGGNQPTTSGNGGTMRGKM